MIRRWWKWGLAGIMCLALAAFVAGVLTLRSDWFREQVRRKIIEVAEEATGGRVELARFHYDWSAMTARVEGFTLRGLEAEDRKPLAQIPTLELAIHVRSLVRRDVELRRLIVQRPAVHVYVAEDGTTNLPAPARPRDKRTNVIEDLLRLRIGRLDVVDGMVHYDSREIPVDARAEGVGVVLTHPGGDLIDYALDVAKFGAWGREGYALQASGTLAAQRVEVKQAQLIWRGSRAEVSGVVEDFRAPKFAGDVKARVMLREWPELVLDGGRADVAGRVSWSDAEGWRAAGRLSGEDLQLELEDFSLGGARLATAFDWAGSELRLTETRLTALGGEWRGRVKLTGWRDLEVEGEAKGLSVARIAAAAKLEEFPWDAELGGAAGVTAKVTAEGFERTVARADVAVTPVEGQVALEGQVAGEWRQREGTLWLKKAHLATASSRLVVEGTLGERLSAGLFSTNPRDLEPVLAMILGEGVEVPVRLAGGSLQAEAVVEGPLREPSFEGVVKLSQARWRDVAVDGGETRFRLSSKELRLDQLDLTQNGGRIQGRVRLGLSDWKLAEAAPVEASLLFKGLRLAEASRLAGLDLALDGVADGALQASGTLDEPKGTLEWQGRQMALGRERFTRLDGKLRVESAEVLRVEGNLDVDGAIVALNGAYRHAAGDWSTGEASLRLKTSGVRLGQSATVRQWREGLDARVSLEGDAVVALKKGEAELRRLNGFLALDGIREAPRELELGSLRIDVRTEQARLRLAMAGKVNGTPVSGSSEVALAPGYPANGTLRLADLPLSTIANWMGGEGRGPRGSVSAQLDWRGELADLRKIRAVLTIPKLELSPELGGDPGRGEAGLDFTLKNAGPLRVEIDSQGMQVSNARLTGRETNITLAGLYSFSSSNPFDLSLSGTVNMGVLTSLEPDLQASGVARVSANLRGTPINPSISGRMSIHDASLYLRGLTNGIEKANGTFYFDRDRATIETLTAATGGGTLALGGFVGFGGGELTYRLQAKAQGVRVRYPEGVSTTLDADLSLTGSENASLLSGLVTVQRSGFSSRGDFASLVAGSGNPIPLPATQNELLRNMQFDVRVRTSPNATFQTDYTQDIQTEADLRVRGSLAKPVVLGSVNVNQGEINFFGNRYTILRGEVLFFNTATIQPSINLDLETRIRGVVVYIGVSGPLARLNVNYRSEPPLQSREILALLTVGRAPTATSTGLQQPGMSLGAQQSGAGTNMLAEASNTLLAGALSASVSSRVEKFFGVSRIKIDPNVTGVENLPQARLTIEQSLSRDITLTFSANLSQSSQQIIRLEWDLSRQWSAIAVRDENGAFGLDFLYRKRFK
jgi:translocation and assembly module TamB